MLKINKLCAIVAISLAPVVSAEELSDTGIFLDGVAAIVNDGVVLKSQLREQTARILKRATDENMQLPPADVLREQLLERLILTEIQLQRAAMIGLQVSDQMLNESIGRIAAQGDAAFEDMPRLLAEDGVDAGELNGAFEVGLGGAGGAVADVLAQGVVEEELVPGASGAWRSMTRLPQRASRLESAAPAGPPPRTRQSAMETILEVLPMA